MGKIFWVCLLMVFLVGLGGAGGFTGYAVGNPTFEIFSGSVVYDNESVVADGAEVMAEIAGGISATTFVVGGNYGEDLEFILEGGDGGDIVVFSVGGVVVGEEVYSEYAIAIVNLIVPFDSVPTGFCGDSVCDESEDCSLCEADCGACSLGDNGASPGGPGGGGGGNGGDSPVSISPDKEENLDKIDEKPAEENVSEIELPLPEISKKKSYLKLWVYVIIGVGILGLVLIVVWIILLRRGKKVRRKREKVRRNGKR